MRIFEPISKFGQVFKRAHFSHQEYLRVIPQSMRDAKNIISVLQASSVDSSPEDFALNFIKAARSSKILGAAKYRMDRVSTRHVPMAERIAMAGLHGDEEWQKFYEAFRICNYQLQPEWCKKVISDRLSSEFEKMRRPDYSTVFGESICSPGRTYQSISSQIRSKFKGDALASNLGLLGISTYRRAIDTMDRLDELLIESRLVEDGDDIGLSPGDNTHFGRLSRMLSREGFRCLLLASLIEDLCRGEKYPLSDESKELLFRQIIEDPIILSDPWLLKTNRAFQNIEFTTSEYSNRPELANYVSLPTLLHSAVRDDMRSVDRALRASLDRDKESSTVKFQSDSRSCSKSNIHNTGSIKDQFYEYLNALGGEKLGSEEKLEIYRLWKRAPRDIRPEISVYAAANSFNGMTSYLDTLVHELKSLERRKRFELNGTDSRIIDESNGEAKEPEGEFSVRYVMYEDGESSFPEWFSRVKNPKARQAILSRIERIKCGHLGDHHPLIVDPLILDVQIHIHGGARIYLTKRDFEYVILWGGTKDTQAQDITEARKLRQTIDSNN